MNIKTKSKRNYLVPAAGVLAMALLLPTRALAQTAETLGTTDAANTSSITGTTNWFPLGAAAPTSAGASSYTYAVAGGFSLRTPTNATPTTVNAGTSLTLNSTGVLFFKGPGLLTIPNLILSGGNITQAGTGATPDEGFLAGNINLVSNSTLAPSSSSTAGRILNISAVITNGAGTNANLTVSAAGGTLLLSGQNTFNGNITVANTTPSTILQLGVNNALPQTAMLTLSGGSSAVVPFDMNGYSQTLSNLTMSGGTFVGHVTNTAHGTTSILTLGYNAPSGANDTLNNGTITDNPSAAGTVVLTEIGAGTLTIGSTNTYSGDTIVSSGTLKMGASSVMPNGAGKGNLVVNGTFDISGRTESVNGLSGSGIIDNSGGTAGTSYILTIEPSNSVTTNVFSGIIQNTLSSAYVGLTVTSNGVAGSGMEFLTGVNTFNGPVNVLAGQLWINNGSALGAGPKVVTISDSSNAGADSGLYLSNSTANISLAANLTFLTGNPSGGGAIVNVAGNNTINGLLGLTSGGATLVTVNAGTLALTGGVTISNQTSRSLTFSNVLGTAGTISGVMSDLNGGSSTPVGATNMSLIKVGAGTLTFAAANIYHGATTVSAGTLVLGSGGSIGGSSVTVSSGATLSNANTTASSIGGATTFSSGGLAAFTGVGGGSSAVGAISVTSNLTLNTTAVTVGVTGSSLAAGDYPLMTCGGTLSGSANSTPTIAGTALATGYTAAVSTTTGSGGHFDLVVNATPTISIASTAPSITYGTTSVILSGTVSSTSGPTTVYAASGDAVTATINGHTVTGFVSGSAGVFTITYNDPSLATDAVNSYPITYVYGGNSAVYLNAAANNTSTSLTVNKATATVTASAQSKTYGSVLTFGSGSALFTSSTLSNSETIGSVTLSCSGGPANTPVGPYTITPSAATGGTFGSTNYNITYVTNTLTVNPLPVVLTGTRPYDGTSNVLAAILTISNNLDGPNLGITGSGTLASASVGGPYAITDFGSLTLTGTAATNYTLTGSSSTVTITLAVPTVTCPSDISDTNASGECGNTESFDATTNDTGGPTTLTYTIPGPTTITSPYFFPVGTTVVTATVTNAAGTNSCTFNVIISDTTPPVPGPFSLGAVDTMTASVPIVKLLILASETSPPGVTLTITNPTATFGTVGISGGMLTYLPTGNYVGPDTINYTLSDGCGTATGTISVTVSANGPGSNGITITGTPGSANLQFFGIPGQAYYIQMSSPGATGPWTDVVQLTADSTGMINYTVNSPPSPSFYRTSVNP